jgi:hypothetical protein
MVTGGAGRSGEGGLEVRRALITGIAVNTGRPDDYVVATGESHTVREFCHAAMVDADVALLEDELAGRMVRIDRP